ncbi:ABC transporter ATP-binding protein [Nocardioides albidus]|uniref:ABC transporter ATP-binding protein n=1 Tax=Nocardioides albidus TaxID=1517589 RepID=A0A5C4WRB8_9ACTN|nr:ABC transporter ATP-binding protein [Nocardioides albidus]TNM50205.1 ABC transporter ATP-binding protein [Nocardioides albidus]
MSRTKGLDIVSLNTEVPVPAPGERVTPRPVLEVSDLRVSYPTVAGPVEIVSGFDLTVAKGERVALVGESGSGKSVTARALLRLDHRATVSGRILLDGTDLLTLSGAEMRARRGRRIGLMLQDPMTTLNPVRTIGSQVMEALRVHGVGRAEARRRSVETLDMLGIPDAARRMRSYPHEFSGGMRQRVCLAMAIVAHPDLLIADEPTTALDVRVQEQVLSLIDSLVDEIGMGVVLITHDLGLVAGFADRVSVMYAGRGVERGPVRELYRTPRHPYTAGLLASVPRVDRDGALAPIAGSPAQPASRPGGCAFHPRCARAESDCATVLPEPRRIGAADVACHHPLTAAEEGPR